MDTLFNSLSGLKSREKELLNLMAVLLIEKPCNTKKLAKSLGLNEVDQPLVNDIVGVLDNAAQDEEGDLANLINGALSAKCCG